MVSVCVCTRASICFGARNALVLYIKKERNTILYLIYYRTEEIVSAGKKRKL